ncbi:MAG TPA: hypothetical protein V6D08_03510 [Candidatus Obscuribacterales bacterium]
MTVSGDYFRLEFDGRKRRMTLEDEEGEIRITATQNGKDASIHVRAYSLGDESKFQRQPLGLWMDDSTLARIVRRFRQRYRVRRSVPVIPATVCAKPHFGEQFDEELDLEPYVDELWVLDRAYCEEED